MSTITALAQGAVRQPVCALPNTVRDRSYVATASKRSAPAPDFDNMQIKSSQSADYWLGEP